MTFFLEKDGFVKLPTGALPVSTNGPTVTVECSNTHLLKILESASTTVHCRFIVNGQGSLKLFGITTLSGQIKGAGVLMLGNVHTLESQFENFIGSLVLQTHLSIHTLPEKGAIDLTGYDLSIPSSGEAYLINASECLFSRNNTVRLESNVTVTLRFLLNVGAAKLLTFTLEDRCTLVIDRIIQFNGLIAFKTVHTTSRLVLANIGNAQIQTSDFTGQTCINPTCISPNSGISITAIDFLTRQRGQFDPAQLEAMFEGLRTKIARLSEDFRFLRERQGPQGVAGYQGTPGRRGEQGERGERGPYGIPRASGNNRTARNDGASRSDRSARANGGGKC